MEIATNGNFSLPLIIIKWLKTKISLNESVSDRTTCPAIQRFVRSIPNSDRTLSVDRPLFPTLTCTVIKVYIMNDSVVKLYPIVKGLSLRSFNSDLARALFQVLFFTVSSNNLIFNLFKITEKKRKFFEEPPPQVMHQTFTTMNLSRPLLKVL